MNIVLDACSIINLIHAGCLQIVLTNENNTFYVGETLLFQEILNDSQKTFVETFIENKQINTIESSISYKEITELTTKYDLGIGETECLAICKNFGYTICTDDQKARKCASKEIGNNNVIGSLYLLKEIVKFDLIKCFEAFNMLSLMKKRGGFLPQIQQDYFCVH